MQERAAHADAERRWQALVDNSPVAIAVLGPTGRFRYVNRQAVTLLAAQDAEELLRRALPELVDPDCADDAQTFLHQVQAGPSRTPTRRRWTLTTRGTARTVEAVAAAITYLGQPAIQTELRDITDQVSADQAMRDSQTQLAAVAAVARSVQAGQDPRQLIVDSVHHLAAAAGVELVERGIGERWRVTAAAGVDTVSDTPRRESPAMQTVLSSGEPVFVAEVHHDEELVTALPVGTHSAHWQPVTVRGDVVAVIVTTWQRPVQLANSVSLGLTVFADETANALQADKLHDELARSASTDPLTGLLNRRAWSTRLDAAIAEARQKGTALTVAMVDLDHFKNYNDTHGHAAGDTFLEQFAAAGRSCLRHDDIFARWGGEEFIVALPALTPQQARSVLTRLHRSVPDQQTCSIGHTTWRDDEPVAATIARADAALYDAKRNGRDRLAER